MGGLHPECAKFVLRNESDVQMTKGKTELGEDILSHETSPTFVVFKEVANPCESGSFEVGGYEDSFGFVGWVALWACANNEFTLLNERFALLRISSVKRSWILDWNPFVRLSRT